MVLRWRPCRSRIRYALARSGGNSRINSGQLSIQHQPPGTWSSDERFSLQPILESHNSH